MNAARSVDGWSSLFWAAFKLSANPMFLLQPDRVVTGVNDAFLNSFGYTRRSESSSSALCLTGTRARRAAVAQSSTRAQRR